MASLTITAGVVAYAEQEADPLRRLGVRVDVAELITGRAALLGLTARGQVSAGGATHLLPAMDGWCALTLSRADDIAAVPALLETAAVDDDPWPAVHRWAATRTSLDIAERATLLEIPVAMLGEAAAGPPRVRPCGATSGPRSAGGLLVADLTSLWAGPLCGQLLARAGAMVVKVESPRRPDGTRAGQRDFYDWMNAGKLSYAVDFNRESDQVRALLTAADVVLEGSRPAALARRGLGPHDVAARAGRVWLRITGHGADSNRVAFGDDAAVAGGLVGHGADGPVFCGDAIADPLTGLAAAAAVFGSLGDGGGALIEVSLARVAASYAAVSGPPNTEIQAVAPASSATAAELGADNAMVNRLLAKRTERFSGPC